MMARGLEGGGGGEVMCGGGEGCGFEGGNAVKESNAGVGLGCKQMRVEVGLHAHARTHACCRYHFPP